ncbi:unnamed protein product [Bemisia tabaci]|uniref:Uncharacterized protein n=2 Tax=Bemisia tabaci TaxID=7038 RepID=A0A9P0C8R9_BEMTA|nr:unnamed protein product [Bemisia tabaci]
MKAALSFLTFSLICTLIYGLPTPEDDTLDSFNVDDECADGGNEATKEACNGKLISKDELSSSIKSNLNKIGVTGMEKPKDKETETEKVKQETEKDKHETETEKEKDKPKLERRTHGKDDSKNKDIDETIRVLKDLKNEVKAAYIGTVKLSKKLDERIKPEQAEMLVIYLRQLKIATDYSVEKIDDCVRKLRDEKKGDRESMGYSSGGGVSDTVAPALVNVFNQYDSVYEFVSDLQ